MCACSEVIVMRCCGLWCEECMQCVMRIVQSHVEQLVVKLFQQLVRNTSTRWKSVAVMKPRHAGDTYVNLDTTTALKTVCRPTCW